MCHRDASVGEKFAGPRRFSVAFSRKCGKKIGYMCGRGGRTKDIIGHAETESGTRKRWAAAAGRPVVAVRRVRLLTLVLLFCALALVIDAVAGERGWIANSRNRRQERTVRAGARREAARERRTHGLSGPAQAAGPRHDRGDRAPGARAHPPGREGVHSQGRVEDPEVEARDLGDRARCRFARRVDC